jgi:hypothetical protein
MSKSGGSTELAERAPPRVWCVRVPDSAPPLLQICRCACCGGLRRVALVADYISTEGNTRSPRILKG